MLHKYSVVEPYRSEWIKEVIRQLGLQDITCTTLIRRPGQEIDGSKLRIHKARPFFFSR